MVRPSFAQDKRAARDGSFDSESSGLRPAYSSLRTFDVKVEWTVTPS